MNPQRHVILRQTVELTIASQEGAWQLQQEASQIMRRAEALIERCCDELSASDRLHRIDRLELDLGRLDPDRLEEELLAKFGESLRRGLAEQIGRQESGDPTPMIASQLELFDQYLRQGNLPWWADLAATELPQQSLDILLRDAPELLERQLSVLVQDALALRRLVGHFDDRQLAAIAALPLPGDFPALLFQALLAAGGSMARTSSLPTSRLRTQLWQSILHTTVFAGSATTDRLLFFNGAVHRWAILLGCSKAALLEGLVQVLPLDEPVANDLLETLLSGIGPVGYAARTGAGTQVGYAARTGAGTQVGYAARTGAGNGTHSADGDGTHSVPYDDRDHAQISEWLSALHEYLPEPIISQLLASLGLAYATGGPVAVHAELEHWLISLNPVEAQRNLGLAALLAQLTPAVGYAMRTSIVNPDGTHIVPYGDGGGTHSVPYGDGGGTHSVPYADRGGTRSVPYGYGTHSVPYADGDYADENGTRSVPYTYSDTDELYLGNAGLVILWPFIKTFFDRLDLLEVDRFKSEGARQRGVALLQYLATEDPAPPEYLLPLNKLLCGIELDAVFELEYPLTEAERDECNSLLTAVIAQAPILNNMSIPGFRGSFLLRLGILSLRDGIWLLRVERETYDLVLDRFPWGFEWVKLPWMETPLQVEW